MKYVVTLSYDGTEFCGWQHQPNGRAVQDALETAIEKFSGERVRVVGSGRTDAGVHALSQVAHFSLDREYPDHVIVSALNAYLPRTVRVLSARSAGEEFDARKSVKKKTYMYLMYRGAPIPVLNDRATAVGDVDCAAMQTAAAALVGRHDFATFRASGGGAKTTVRTVFDAHVESDGKFIKFFITADGFLYNMVRIITAQLIKIGKGENVDLTALMEKRDRTYAKEIAPACGLYLYSVEYPPEDLPRE